MKIILCGYNWAGCKALELLIKSGHEVFVYTHENPDHIPSLINYAKSKKIDFTTKNISRSKLPFKPDIIISVYYRYLISPEIISAANGKIFNLHPSLLPKYRGCSSVTWALINGEKQYGYTYHYIDEKFDTGNIILQKKLTIEDFDTQDTLYKRVMFEAMKDLNQVIKMVKNSFLGKKQPRKGINYKRGCPHEGKINPKWGEEKIERFIRAMINPPLSYATYKKKKVVSYQEYLEIVNMEKNLKKK